MASNEHDSLDWEEVEVTDSIPLDEDHGLSLEGGDEIGEQDTSREGDCPYAEQADPAAANSTPDDPLACITPKTILEAILYVGTPDNRPLTSSEIADLMRGVRADEVDELIEELNEEYIQQNSAFGIVSEGGGYRMALCDELDGVRAKFYGRTKEARLSQAAVDVLAIIAYRQPISREKVDQLRGKGSGGLLNQLVRRGLVRLELSGRRPIVRLFHTTPRFLELLGINNLDELPRSEDD